MIRKIKNLIWKILIALGIAGPLQLMLNGGILEDGWFRSFNTKQSVDKNGNPIPWYSYSSIKFIKQRLKNSFDVFEFGSGNSTLWYAEKVKSITAVEHDKNWFENVSKRLPSNAEIIHRSLDDNGEYAKEVLNNNIFFDIIVIDGRDRNNCVKHSLSKLKNNGVIIFDNTQREKYTLSIEFLISNGFKRIDFTGMLPIVSHNNTTTIFYRKNNCFDI